MGRRAKKKREQKNVQKTIEKKTIEQIKVLKNPLYTFWRRFDFWTYIVVIAAIVAYVFIPNLPGKAITPPSYAILKTSKGDITVQLYRESAPKTVDNFIKLAKEGFYNNLTFHRVIKDFVIQGGDPKGDGTGGPGYTFEDEINPAILNLTDTDIQELEGQGYTFNYDLDSEKMLPGSMAMANSGPNTNGSQFFIVTEKAQPSLDGKHTVFAQVTKGMETVKAIAEVEVDDKDKPKEAILINSIELK